MKIADFLRRWFASHADDPEVQAAAESLEAAGEDLAGAEADGPPERDLGAIAPKPGASDAGGPIVGGGWSGPFWCWHCDARIVTGAPKTPPLRCPKCGLFACYPRP